MKSVLERLDRLLLRFEALLAALAVGLLIVITLSVIAEVTLRYGFNRPLTWVVEMTEHALLYLAFLGASWTLRHDGHVGVDLFVGALPRRGRLSARVLSALIGAAVAGVMLVFGALVTVDAYERGLFKPTLLEVPTWMVILSIPLGSAALFLRFLIDAAMAGYSAVSGVATARETPIPEE